jgi:hypothetical protein
MECLAVLAVSSALIFSRLAIMQDLNPFLWGFLGLAAYAGPPVYMIWRGASWIDAPWVWISSFVALFLLFVAQSILAERKRYRGRGGTPSVGKKAGAKAKKRKDARG